MLSANRLTVIVLIPQTKLIKFTVQSVFFIFFYFAMDNFILGYVLIFQKEKSSLISQPLSQRRKGHYSVTSRMS